VSVLAIGSIGYFLYQKKRVKDLNERVDNLEDALDKIRSI
jgi:hypothetical protein